mmetsp:Transcript_32053/g.37672  ORF Transcript_32053/g.37672 Transcript_32053/m.37672 type:complete len:116 (+) Transcript_32053:41-388(+)|eukprot:CAMPEP_0114359236 /NCGR_PEP_ID=MMETSP0101-20121206/22860_1 /TAXON_ID=38822 ORGANISM="Pteridomonas danica, Strain PT" /NCGR_SAMPLE_ID=MMETSP0101 /ASSEMBLY_ACC=CAM_ASM_000211 /LENGTH=115 /DNA_ID=CAMNT_0001502667 /DNA_START=44 /DNA_END=388 /DNA_ORIENTATION=-
MPLTNTKKTVTSTVRSSLFGSLLEKLSSEHDALLGELGLSREETLRFERQVKHQFTEMLRIKQMVTELEKKHAALKLKYEEKDQEESEVEEKKIGRKRTRSKSESEETSSSKEKS